MKTFIIYTFGYSTDSGGSIVLYKLRDMLTDQGRQCFIFNSSSDAVEREPFKSLLKRDDTITIYPEVILGNPLNSKRCVRWILNNPGRFIVNCSSPSEDLYYQHCSPSDLYFNYSDIFKVRKELKGYGGLLTVININRNLFRNTNPNERTKTCYFVKKGGISKTEHPSDSINISNTIDDAQKAQIFNECKYLYCYDNECFNVVLASLCGCIAIVIPNGKYTAEEWYTKFPWKTCGIAYGNDKLELAEQTLENIKECIDKYEGIFLDSVKNFIKKCEET